MSTLIQKLLKNNNKQSSLSLLTTLTKTTPTLTNPQNPILKDPIFTHVYPSFPFGYPLNSNSPNGFCPNSDFPNGFGLKSDSANGFCSNLDSANGFGLNSDFSKGFGLNLDSAIGFGWFDENVENESAGDDDVVRADSVKKKRKRKMNKHKYKKLRKALRRKSRT